MWEDPSETRRSRTCSATVRPEWEKSVRQVELRSEEVTDLRLMPLVANGVPEPQVKSNLSVEPMGAGEADFNKSLLSSAFAEVSYVNFWGDNGMSFVTSLLPKYRVDGDKSSPASVFYEKVTAFRRERGMCAGSDLYPALRDERVIERVRRAFVFKAWRFTGGAFRTKGLDGRFESGAVKTVPPEMVIMFIQKAHVADEIRRLLTTRKDAQAPFSADNSLAGELLDLQRGRRLVLTPIRAKKARTDASHSVSVGEICPFDASHWMPFLAAPWDELLMYMNPSDQIRKIGSAFSHRIVNFFLKGTVYEACIPDDIRKAGCPDIANLSPMGFVNYGTNAPAPPGYPNPGGFQGSYPPAQGYGSPQPPRGFAQPPAPPQGQWGAPQGQSFAPPAPPQAPQGYGPPQSQAPPMTPQGYMPPAPPQGHTPPQPPWGAPQGQSFAPPAPPQAPPGHTPPQPPWGAPQGQAPAPPPASSWAPANPPPFTGYVPPPGTDRDLTGSGINTAEVDNAFNAYKGQQG